MHVITYIRTRGGLSQQDFARLAGVTQATVSRWENDDFPSGECYRAVRKVGLKILGDEWDDALLFGAPDLEGPPP